MDWLSNLAGQAWLIDQSWLDGLHAGAAVTSFGSRQPRHDKYPTMPIYGVIVPRGSSFGLIQTTTTEAISDFLSANAHADKIILDIDSPGGAVTGVSELADKIYAMRHKVEARVSGMAASAAYWLASAAGKVVVSDTAEVGSIGVVLSLADFSGALERNGITVRTITSKNAPLKRPDLASDETLQYYQSRVDDIASVFESKVARYRGVSPEYVSVNFGRGGLVGARKALEAGMVDQILSVESSNGVGIMAAAEAPNEAAAQIEALKAENQRLKAELESAKNEVAETKKVLDGERSRILGLIAISGGNDSLSSAVEAGLSPGDLAIQILSSSRTTQGTGKPNQQPENNSFVAFSAAAEQTSSFGSELIAAARRLRDAK